MARRLIRGPCCIILGPWARAIGKDVIGSKGIIETKVFQQFVFNEFIKNRSWGSIENIAKDEWYLYR